MSSILAFVYILLSVLPFGNRQIEVQQNYFHPVHVSYTNVEFKSDKKQFNILFKIFADDFDKIIYKKYHVLLNLEKGEKPDGYNKIVSKYITEHFKVTADNKDYTAKLKFNYLELKEKAVWLHYTFKFKYKVKQFEILNSLMTDLYHDQTNLLIFNYNEFQQAIRFTNKKTKIVLSINPQ